MRLRKNLEILMVKAGKFTSQSQRIKELNKKYHVTRKTKNAASSVIKKTKEGINAASSVAKKTKENMSMFVERRGGRRAI